MLVIVVQVMAMSHGHGGDGRNEVDGGDELKSCTSGVKMCPFNYFTLIFTLHVRGSYADLSLAI